jgi:farnesyl-diphosphate farnesyltransferase
MSRRSRSRFHPAATRGSAPSSDDGAAATFAFAPRVRFRTRGLTIPRSEARSVRDDAAFVSRHLSCTLARRTEDKGMSMMKIANALRDEGRTEEPGRKGRYPSSATGHALDTEFCRRLLPRVSRTFALSIEALPDSLRSAVRIAYLLCRIVDSIEDEPTLVSGQRGELFEMFEGLLGNGEEGLDPAEFELACGRSTVGGAGADGELCRGAGAVVRAFRALPHSQRQAIRPHVLEMTTGMRSYCARGVPLRLADLADLERYCYFVAGTVGNLLTTLFEQTVEGLSEGLRSDLRERAVSFGIGLQMVNVVKDVAADFGERGVCFLPLDLASEHGLEVDRLLDPTMRKPGIAVIRAVCARAREHLRRAEEYVALWPTTGPGGQAGPSVRRFCVVPLALALATLRTVEQANDTLRVGTEPKVSRTTVALVVAEATGAAASNRALATLLGRYREDVSVRPSAAPPR